MEDCHRILQVKKCGTSGAQDIAGARDIARRFEQLENQWMSFQKKSAKLEGVKDNLEKSTTTSPRNQYQQYVVSSAASSYSNPLFTNHTTAKPAELDGARTTSSLSRTCNLYAGSEMKSDTDHFSCYRQKKPGAGATSPTDGTPNKDDRSSSQVFPSTPGFGSSCPNDEKALLDGLVSPSNETMLTTATMPTFFRDKATLGPIVQTPSKAANIANEKYVRCASSIARQTFRTVTDHRKDLQSSFTLSEILGRVLDKECPQLSSSVTRSSAGDDFRKSDAEMIESIDSITCRCTSNPEAFSTGNGSSESRLSPTGLEQLNDASINQSRTASSAAQSSTTDADLQLNPLLGYAGVSERNISWRVLAERDVLTEGSLRMDRHPYEFDSEEESTLPTDVTTKASPKDGNLLKLEVQIEQKNVKEAEHIKLGDRLDKVNWELRLSKKEAALRIAEERILDEERNISQVRLAVGRYEDALRLREQDMQRESEKQKIDLVGTLNSIETGKAVMKTLCAGLKDVLWHMEQKEKAVRNTWLELKDSLDPESLLGDHSFGFDPELSQKEMRSATFDGISFLAAEGKCDQWCSTVVEICERLVTYMSRETHLQKWATVLEREGIRMGKMIKEMDKAKEAASEQWARSEDMMKWATEQASCMNEERVKLARERDKLILWVTHLQERRKAVGECEKEAAKSLAEIQKKAVDLFVHESNIGERAVEITALQEELRVTSQRLQDDQECINLQNHKVQEKFRLIAEREGEVESKISAMRKFQEELNTKAEQLEKDRVDEKRKEILLLTIQQTEGRINARESSLCELEKELERKYAAVEQMTINVNDREKLLTDLQMRMDLERSKILEVMTGLEKEKVRLKEAEEAWDRTAQERRESSEYLRSVEDRLKQWEDRLRNKEKELQAQKRKLHEIENQARDEQEHSEALHAKLVQEQESWTQELKAKQESLSNRNSILDVKEEEINNDLERLTEERRVALEDIKRLAEMEAKAWGAERDLQTKHNEHLKEVRKHASEYNSQMESLAVAKLEVKKGYEEVRAKKQELKIWQREAEETLQNRIDSFLKGKEELTAQIMELKKLQTDIEQAGSQIIDRVAELDQASSRLERQRYKVETSKNKLETLADNLAIHQEVLKRRECEFLTQESKLVAVQNGLKKMAADAATKEKNLRSREQAVADSEKDFRDVEARVAMERKDLEKMIAEVEQHAAKLKEETASVEEISRSRARDELLLADRREKLECKERELEEFEADLLKKAKNLEEHGQIISKLEMQVKERLQRAADFESKSAKLEIGEEHVSVENEALHRPKVEIQKRAESDGVQQRMDPEEDAKESEELARKRVEKMDGLETRQGAMVSCKTKTNEMETASLKTEFLAEGRKDQVEKDALELSQQLQSDTEISAGFSHRMNKSDKREVRFNPHLSKELKTPHSLVHNQMDKGMEDRMKRMEETLEKEASKICEERANLKLQQLDLEETRKVVEEVKLTLEVQLKATKQMVADASMSAQNASREREALEEERKRLAQDRMDAEASAAAKKEKMATEAKQIEIMKSVLEEEKAKAMEMIQKVARKAMSVENAKKESSVPECSSTMLNKESLKDREKHKATDWTISRDQTHMTAEKAQVQTLQDLRKREQMETSNDSRAKNADQTGRDMRKRGETEVHIGESNGCQVPALDSSLNDTSHAAEDEFSSSTMRGEDSRRNNRVYVEDANYRLSKTEWDEAFDSSLSCNQIPSERPTADYSSRQTLEKSDGPSRKRLENVMTSLMHARQASRSRLQRTENALHAFPHSSGFITQVQQALGTLSARLCLMEQIEEGLESHLRDAYETELPECERLLVDKVQLLCRMEEQQSLRAEWEEDMQRQLETISMLQAACRSSPNFASPPEDPIHGAPRIDTREDDSVPMFQDGHGQDSYDTKGRSGGNAQLNPSTDLHNGVVSRLSKHFSKQNWNAMYSPNDHSLDTKGLSSYSPFVDYEYLSNPAHHSLSKYGTQRLESHERSTRRKLLLSPPNAKN